VRINFRSTGYRNYMAARFRTVAGLAVGGVDRPTGGEGREQVRNVGDEVLSAVLLDSDEHPAGVLDGSAHRPLGGFKIGG